MTVKELIKELFAKYAEFGNVPVKIIYTEQDEDGEEWNHESDIECVSDMLGDYIYISPEG